MEGTASVACVGDVSVQSGRDRSPQHCRTQRDPDGIDDTGTHRKTNARRLGHGSNAGRDDGADQHEWEHYNAAAASAAGRRSQPQHSAGCT